MLVKLLNDIMYKEDKTKDTFLYKWALENEYKYQELWKATQKLQDFLYHLRNSQTSLYGLRLLLKENNTNETEQLSLEIDKKNL